MSATVSGRPLTASDSLLRLAMRADAILVALAGAVMIVAAAPLSSFTGVPAGVQYGLGAAFIVYGFTVFGLAALERVRPGGIGAMIANLVCTVAAVIVVVTGVLPLTTAGVVYILAMGVYTAVFAELQYAGLRRITA